MSMGRGMGRGNRSANKGRVIEASPRGSDPIIRKYQIDNKTTRADSLITRLNNGDLDVNPPYQRGDVWNEERQRSLIKSITMGLPVGSIFINHRDLMQPDVVVDGKQRLEAIRAFLHGELKVPKSWFGGEFFEDDVPDDISFLDMGDVGQRLWKNSAVINVSETQLQDNPIEDETEMFNLINFAGVEQGQSDFDSDSGSIDESQLRMNFENEDEELAAELSYRSDQLSIRAWEKGLDEGDREAVLEANRVEPFAEDPSKRLLNIKRNKGLVEIIFLSDDNKKVVIKRSLDPNTLG